MRGSPDLSSPPDRSEEKLAEVLKDNQLKYLNTQVRSRSHPYLLVLDSLSSSGLRQVARIVKRIKFSEKTLQERKIAQEGKRVTPRTALPRSRASRSGFLCLQARPKTTRRRSTCREILSNVHVVWCANCILYAVLLERSQVTAIRTNCGWRGMQPRICWD